MPNLVKIGLELLPQMSGNQVGRRTAENAKIICPPPSGVDIITTALLNSGNLKVAIAQLCNWLKVYNFIML